MSFFPFCFHNLSNFSCANECVETFSPRLRCSRNTQVLIFQKGVVYRYERYTLEEAELGGEDSEPGVFDPQGNALPAGLQIGEKEGA